MLKPLSVLLAASLLLGCRPANLPAQPQHSDLLNAFRSRFESRVSAFIKLNPQLLTGYRDPESPTGARYGVSEFRDNSLSFSIAEVEDQIQAYLDLDATMLNQFWGTCGDYKYAPDDPSSSFTTEAGALAARNRQACYVSTVMPLAASKTRLRFSYAYQNGAWTYLNVVSRESRGYEMEAITQILGKQHDDQLPVASPEGIALNQGWRSVFLSSR